MSSRHLHSVPAPSNQAAVLAEVESALTEIETHREAIGELVSHVREVLGDLPAPAPEPEPELLSMDQAASKLGVSHSFVKKAIARHEIQVERFGRRVLVPIEAIEAYREAARRGE